MEHSIWKSKLDGIEFYTQLDKLHEILNEVSGQVNARVLQMIREKFNLVDHCLALKKFLLLGQGDFVQQLLERSG